MLVPSPHWLDSGDNAWQMTAATLVAAQSVPGLALLYGGSLGKKWATNSAFMVIYAFAAVLIVWVLWAYNMSFGAPLAPFLGVPAPVAAALDETRRASIPAAAAAMPELAFPMATLVYFQFVFAALSVIVVAGSVLGRMRLSAWMLFVPLWITAIYTVDAYSLWGGGWLARIGVLDYSGGYVVHLAAATSGFVAAWVVGPRAEPDRGDQEPNSLFATLAGAGLLWIGWNGFNGGDPFFANAAAAAAVLNTNIAACAALLAWMAAEVVCTGEPSITGAVNGMIAGLVGITSSAGYVNGFGAMAIGLACGILPWFTMHKLGRLRIFRKVDDALGVIHTHGFPALAGGLFVGVLADPAMVEYFGTGKSAPGIRAVGWLYGNPHQLLLQLAGGLFIIAFNAIGTFALLKLIGFFVPLRMDELAPGQGDRVSRGEDAIIEAAE